MKPIILSKTTTEEQTELTNDFIKEFYKRFKYAPTVIINNYKQSKVRILSLEDLGKCFDPFLPKQRGKTIELGSNERYRNIAELRHMFCFIAKSMNYTLKDIGTFLNNRDHSTVIHSIDVFRNLYQTDEFFKERFNKILNHIKEEHESSIMDHVNQVWD